MNIDLPTPNKFPFTTDPNHVYRQLSEKGISTIDVGHITFQLALVSNLDHDGTSCYGVTDFDDNTIKLDVSMPDIRARETIFHEIFHIVLDNLGLDDINFKNDMISITNEALVVGVSRQFSVLNRLNPGLLSLVMDVPRPCTEHKKKK